MGGSALSGAAGPVAAIERSADMDALRESVRLFAGRLGYDRFILYTASPGDSPEDRVVGHLLWVEGD